MISEEQSGRRTFIPKMRFSIEKQYLCCLSSITISPDLHHMLSQISIPASTCQITSFLTDRRQQMKLDHITSNTLASSTSIPQGCVLSPLLFSLYTNDCISEDPSVKLLKFPDITVIGFIQDGDESASEGTWIGWFSCAVRTTWS